MTTKKVVQHKSVPWWTQRLTILRKKVNAQRRRYQRTKGNIALCEQRKEQYMATKAEYAATIRKESFTSWKEYCTTTSATNPWNAIYKLAAGRRKQTAPTTTLRQKDGKLTTNLHETLQYMIQNLTPAENQDDDNAIHKQIRAITQETIDTEDDKEFSVQEVKNAVVSMGEKKTPGEDGMPSRVYKRLMEILLRYITEIYNGCLTKGTFPKRWKKAVIIPIIKPGQEGSVEVSKYRPISLLDTGGKVLEKIMINRINHHVYSRGYMNENQYGFRPQKCAIDAAITKAFKHVSVIDMSSDRSHFTRHGFHMNSFGKERFPKQVASQIEILAKLSNNSKSAIPLEWKEVVTTLHTTPPRNPESNMITAVNVTAETLKAI